MYAIKNADGEYFAGLNLSGKTAQARWAAVEDGCVMAYMFVDAKTAHDTLKQDDMAIEGFSGDVYVADLDSGEEAVADPSTVDEDDEL